METPVHPMKTLYLARHAKSSWKDPKLNDFDRPLNNRGKRDAPRMGAYLKQQQVYLDLMLTSPAKRALKTARHYAAALHLKPEAININPQIYLASLASLMTLIRGIDNSFNSVMVVGHNPGLTELANHLTHAGIENIPTAGIVEIEIPVEQWGDAEAGSGRCISFVYPKKLFAD